MNENVEKAALESRRFTPGMFAVIALSFLLPFASVTCSGQRLVTFSGTDFVLGTEVSVDEDLEAELDEAFSFGDFGEAEDGETSTPDLGAGEDDRLDPKAFAILALAAAALGLVLTLVLKERRRSVWAIVMAGLVVIGLIGLRIDLNGDMSDGEGIVAVEYRFGYWIAIILAVVIGVAHFLLFRDQGEPGPTDPPPANPEPASGP